MKRDGRIGIYRCCAALAWLLSVACGGSGDDSTPSNTSGGSGGGGGRVNGIGAGGAGGAEAGAGAVSSSADAGAAASAGSSGRAGAGGAGTGGAVAGGAAGSSSSGGGCQGTEARFVVDGEEHVLAAPPGSWYTSAATDMEPGAWRFLVGFTRGPSTAADWYRFALFAGSGDILMQRGGPREVLPEDMPIAIGNSLWALEASATALGEVLCTAPGSGSTLSRSGEELGFDLEQVTSLGSCPAAAPVEGELQMCLGFSCGSARSVTGALDGTTWTVDTGGYTVGSVVHVGFSDGSLLRFANTGTGLTWGVLMTAPVSPFAGAAFCVGSASLAADTMSWTFGDFSRLGTCAGGGTRTLAGCARPEPLL